MKGALAILVASVFPTAATPAAGQEAARQPVSVAAGLALTWEAVRKFVKEDPNARLLQVIEEGPRLRHGRWSADIPSSDFRAGGWAVCQAGADPAVAPRQGRFDVVVQGDSVAVTLLVRVSWSAQDPTQPQVAVGCRTTGVWEREAEKAIRERAEKEQKKRNR